jgi:pimeloyl-ACP methyl ester carboxylesterase
MRIPFLVLVLTSVIAAAAAAQPSSTVERGELGGAPFRIEMPAAWNGELVVYAHGYDMADGKPFPFEGRVQTAIRDGFVSRGYAYLQSGYSKEGWAVEQGLLDTEALRRHFVEKHGAPKTTWVTGHSMGGLITALILEQQPEIYSGGLALCPVLAPAADFFESNFFDLFVAFDLLVGKKAGLAALADPKSPLLDGKAVAAALLADPAAALVLESRFLIRSADLPGILAFYQPIWQELVARAGGIPIDNRNTLYAGFGDDVAFNRGVLRLAGEPAAEAYVKKFATPTGKLLDPLLVVHTTYDPIVPPTVASRYDLLATLAGNKELVRYKFVAAEGHCTISSDQTQRAFDLLRAWAAGGKAPAAGEL